MASSYKELFCFVNDLVRQSSMDRNEYCDKTLPEDVRKRFEDISAPISYNLPSENVELPEKYSDFIKNHLQPTMKTTSLRQSDCANLLKTFLRCEFFGAKKELDEVFRNPQHQRDFAFVLAEYYYTEKLFRLMAVRDSLLIHLSGTNPKSSDESMASSQTTALVLQNEYRTKIVSELKNISDAFKSNAVYTETSDGDMSVLTRLVNELLLLLEILVLESCCSVKRLKINEMVPVFETCAMITAELESLAARDPTNDLGLKFRHIILLSSIYFLQNLPLEGVTEKVLGSEVVINVFQESDELEVNKFNNCLLMFANMFPIVGIAWLSVCQVFEKTNEKITQIGKIALENKVFNQMLMIAASDDIDVFHPIFKNIMIVNFYKLLRCVLTQFQMDNLVESVGIFVSILQTLLASPENGTFFFADLKISTEQNPVGFSALFLQLMSNFPKSACNFLAVLSEIDQFEEAEKVYTVISRLNVGTLSAKEDISLYGNNQSAMAGALNGIEAESIRIDGWLYLKSYVMKFLLLPVGDETFNDDLLPIHAITKIVHSLLKAGLNMPKELVQIVEFFPQLLGKIAIDPLYNEISSEIASYCFGSLKSIATLKPDIVKNELVLSGIYPQLKFDRNELNDCLFTCNIFPMELKASRLEGTKALLDLINTLMHTQSEDTFYHDIQVAMNLLTCFLIPCLGKEISSFIDEKRLEALFASLVLFDELVTLMESKTLGNEQVSTEVSKFLVTGLLQDDTLCIDLLQLLETGNDKLNARLQCEFVFGNFASGVGSLLKNCIKLSLKILSWIWSSACQMLQEDHKTHLEAKLFHENHGFCFKRIVSYVFHQFDSELPILTSQFLYNMTCTKNSYFTFLDQIKEPVRDKFNRVLAKRTENVELRRAIIKLMTKSIDTQPAFLDFMLNFNTCTKKPENPSVILPVIDLIMDDKMAGVRDYGNGKIVISADYESAVELVYVIWADYQEGLQLYLKSLPKFWEQLSKILFSISEKVDPDSRTISCACSVLKTLSIQIHCNSLNNGGDKLRSVVNKFMLEGHFFTWFVVLKKSAGYYIGCEDCDEKARYATLKDLVGSISQLVSVIINRNDAVSIIKQLDRDEVRTIHNNLLYCLKRFLSCEYRQLDSLISIFSMLLLNFIQQFQLTACEQIESLCEILDLAQSVQNVKTCLKLGCSVAASLTIIMQLESAPKISSPELVAIIIRTCHNIVRIYVPGNIPDEMYEKLNELPELKRMCEVCVSLISTLFLQTFSVSLYLEKLAEYDVMETFLRLLKLDVISVGTSKITCSIMSFFVQLSSYKSSAQFLARCNIHQSLCLTLSHSISTKLNQQRSANSDTGRHKTEVMTPCFSTFMVLSGNILSLLEAEYLEQACDIISCFEEEIISKFYGIYTNQTEQFLDQVLSILHFIQEFSAYMKVWRFKLCRNFENITTSMSRACLTCIALLIRPKYLQYLLKHGSHPSARNRLTSTDSSGAGGSSTSRAASVRRSAAISSGGGSSSRQRSLSSTLLTAGWFSVTLFVTSISFVLTVDGNFHT